MQANQQKSTAYLVTFSVKPWFLASWILLIIVSYFFIDQALANYIHVHDIDRKGSALHHWTQTFSNLGEGGLNILLSIVFFLMTWLIKPLKKIRIFALVWIIALLTNGVIVDILKISLGRARPMEWFTTLQYGFYFWQFKPIMWSFPSGHTTIMSTSMTMFSLRWPRYELFCVLIICLIGMSRLVLEQHFLSDVLTGVLIGTGVTTLIYNYANSRGWVL